MMMVFVVLLFSVSCVIGNVRGFEEPVLCRGIDCDATWIPSPVQFFGLSFAGLTRVGLDA